MKSKSWLFGVIGLLFVAYASLRYAVLPENLVFYYIGAGIFGILFLLRFFYKRKKKERAWTYLVFLAIIGIWLCISMIMK